MSAAGKPKYACPHCGSTEYCTQPDSYAIYVADEDGLSYSHTEQTHEAFRLYCRECSEEAPDSFNAAAT